MEGRRRLLLLAVIIVAVAIGAVGITLVTLFEAGVQQQRQVLSARLLDLAAGLPVDARSARVAYRSGGWQETAGNVPESLRDTLAAVADVPAGDTVWLDDPRADYLAGIRRSGIGDVAVAWVSLAELRAPFQRAAVHASIGLLLLVSAGLLLFYRMTAPLLRSIAMSEARYRTLFSSTAEGVLLIGDGIEECNDRFCELFHCRREDVLRLPWRDFFRRYAGDDAGLPAFEDRVEAFLAGSGGPFTWEFHPVAGERLVVEIAMSRLRDGKSDLFLVSLRDVTAREEAARVLKAAEQALRESRDKLAQAGRSSTLVELAAGIAHEVNQPLAAIANYAQASRRLLASGKPCPDDVSVVLDRIAEQAQRAGEAIHRIRALVPSAPTTGTDRTCINRLVRDVVELMREEIAAAGAQVVLDLDEPVPAVLADPLQIQQVIMQLLRNALEAMVGVPEAGRVVCITSRVRGEEVEVAVRDQGHGIPAEDRPRLFDPFYSTREKGMGMGLAISLSIIRTHHGELDIDDTCEHGACFRFRLPVDKSAAGSDATCRDTVAP